jgi:hypothetical protein
MTMNQIPTAIALPLFIFPVVGIVLLLRWKAMRAPPRGALERVADGAVVVPVHGLYLRRAGLFGGMSHNNLNPRFAIAPDGIRFRVFRDSLLPFSHIDHVEVRQRFGFTYLLFVNGTGPRLLSVSIGDRHHAKQLLDALPRSVALTPEAATLRDGTAAAGTSGLRLYGGRFA